MTVPRPTVQLLHELPDGSSHVDWMIAQDARGTRPLVTFRLPRRLDDAAAGERLDAVRLKDHRPVYLSYEGAVSGGRGTVRRLAEGAVVAEHTEGTRWIVEIAWSEAVGGRPQRLGVCRSGAAWTVTVLAGDPQGP